jgi:chromosome segregation ATPase
LANFTFSRGWAKTAILAWAARRRAEAALAGRLADIERQGQALERRRQAIERSQQDAQAGLDALRQDLDAAHAQDLDELEDRMTGVQIALENALVEAQEEARQARAEAAGGKARLETAERGRKNATWAAARMKSKIAQNRPEAAATGGVPGQGGG